MVMFLLIILIIFLRIQQLEYEMTQPPQYRYTMKSIKIFHVATF